MQPLYNLGTRTLFHIGIYFCFRKPATTDNLVIMPLYWMINSCITVQQECVIEISLSLLEQGLSISFKRNLVSVNPMSILIISTTTRVATACKNLFVIVGGRLFPVVCLQKFDFNFMD